MADRPNGDDMRALEDRIAALKGVPAATHHSDEHYSQAHVGWRMVIEMVAGIVIGFGMGYGLDALLGTLPVFLVAFTLLGFAAGVKTMMRTSRELMDRPGPAPDGETRDGSDR